MIAQKQYCINCGQLIPGGAKFCPHCGAPQRGKEAANFVANAPAVKVNAASFVVEQAQKDAEPASQKSDLISQRNLCSPVIVSFSISYLSKTAILLLLILIGLFIEPAIFSLAFVLYFAAIILMAVIVYNNFSYAVDEKGFQKWYGVIHKQQASIPYHKIQNVNISRSLSDRILGLSRIDIETAGHSGDASQQFDTGGSFSTAEGHLPGIRLKDAKHIHDVLLANSKG